MGYHFLVEYKVGRENRVADALLRKGEVVELCAISTPVAGWASELKERYKNDAEILDILTKMQTKSLSNLPYSWQDDILLYNGKIYLRKKCPLKEAVL